MSSIKKTFLLFILGAFMLVVVILFQTTFASTENENYCHTIDIFQNVSTKYGSPTNFFGDTPELMLKVVCGNINNVTVEVGTGDKKQYIYKYGYRKVNGKWKKIMFSGEKKSGSWFLGNAFATFEDLSRENEGEILAYVCQKVNGKWKCGCGDQKCDKKKWQIQKYSLNSTKNIENKDCKSDDVLDIHYPSVYISYPGKSVVLHGEGFEKCPITEVSWNGKITQTGLASVNGKELAIVVPDFKPGKYEVFVREGEKVSDYSTIIWIGEEGADGNAVAPEITGISPETGMQGDVFTIYGTGFTDNNDIITTFGIINGVKSEDGKSISFKYDPFEEKLKSYDEETLERVTYNVPVYVSVMNTNGKSNMFTFNLEI